MIFVFIRILSGRHAGLLRAALVLVSCTFVSDAFGSFASDLRKHSKVWSDEIHLPRGNALVYPDGISHHTVEDSRSDRYHFLHDAAIVQHKGTLYAAWFNSPETEIADEALVRCRKSLDGGKTWSEIQVIAADTEKRGDFYVPVQLFSHGGELYAFIGRMTGHDAITDCLAYVLDENADRWTRIGKIADRFLPNCPPVRLENGNWAMAGRVASKAGAQPLMPALLVSQGERFTEGWQIKPLQKVDYPANQHPETTIIVEGPELTAFVRNSFESIPYIYTSFDSGENWLELVPHDLQAVASKMFAGTLSNGQKYLLFNYPDFGGKIRNVGLNARGRLAIAVTAPGGDRFVRVWKVQDNGLGKPFSSHYPSAMEYQGNLYVVYTTGSGGGISYAKGLRGCELAIIPMESLAEHNR